MGALQRHAAHLADNWWMHWFSPREHPYTKASFNSIHAPQEDALALFFGYHLLSFQRSMKAVVAQLLMPPVGILQVKSPGGVKLRADFTEK